MLQYVDEDIGGSSMESQESTGEKSYRPLAFKLPLEYWETGKSCSKGGLARTVSEGGLLLYCVQDIPVGTELNVNVFFYDGYELDIFKAVGKIVWKDPLHYGNLEGFQYGLEYTRMSEEDRRKILGLLRGCPLEGPPVEAPAAR
jgi:hypothetical protein